MSVFVVFRRLCLDHFVYIICLLAHTKPRGERQGRSLSSNGCDGPAERLWEIWLT